jgi:hypothetical protein
LSKFPELAGKSGEEARKMGIRKTQTSLSAEFLDYFDENPRDGQGDMAFEIVPYNAELGTLTENFWSQWSYFDKIKGAKGFTALYPEKKRVKRKKQLREKR